MAGDLDKYFTFTGCGGGLYVGKQCTLKTLPIIPDGPVEVIAVSATGFAFRSGPGHPEGAGRTITFNFVTASAEFDYETGLRIEAWGPLSNTSLAGSANATFADWMIWSTFADNLRDRLPTNLPQVYVGPSDEHYA